MNLEEMLHPFANAFSLFCDFLFLPSFVKRGRGIFQQVQQG